MISLRDGVMTMLAAAMLLFAAEASAQTDGGRVSPSQLLEAVSLESKLDAQVPLDLKFRDEAGREIRLRDYVNGKPIVLSLVYFRCPMLCNMVADGLVKSMGTLDLNIGDDFTVLTVSFDPREQPELAAGAKQTALSRYRREGAEAGWHFLTGEAASSQALADSVGFRYLWDEARGQYTHAAMIVVLTPDGRVSRYLHGVEFAPRDLRLSIVEASAGKIGTASDHFMLLCYQYDPSTGKYGLAIQRVLRIAAGLTVACLVGGVLLMLRREKKRNNLAASLATRRGKPRG